MMDIDNALQGGRAAHGCRCRGEYADDDILFMGGVSDLTTDINSLRMDKFVSVACHAGRLRLEMNMASYCIAPREVLCCRPNDIISDTEPSPDFEGSVMCLSPRMVMNMFGESSMLYGILIFHDNPVVKLDGGSARMQSLYEEMLMAKAAMGPSPLRREIVRSIVRASLYEFMENIDCELPAGIGEARAGGTIFKEFVELLSGCRLKPRRVTWYARQLCVTPKYLSTVCKQISGKTASGWIKEYVLMDIAHLLKDTDKPIKEIAGLLDFSNVSAFGTYCRKMFGMAPSECRARMRQAAVDGKTKTEPWER